MQLLVDEIGFEAWDIVYRTAPMIDICKYFNLEQLYWLEKLDIFIQDRVYTEYEYDILKGEVSKYYTEDMDEEDKETAYSLKETDVSKDEYKTLLRIFEMIDERYKKIL